MLKRILSVFAAALIVAFSSNPAQAEFLTVTYDVPLVQKFSNTSVVSTGKASGSMIGASLPLFPVAFGVESYSTPAQLSTLNTTMVDVFYLLPIPLINLTIGAGTGSAEFTGAAQKLLYPKGTMSQWYLQAGMSFGVFDVHIAQRNVSGKMGTTDMSSAVTSAGVMIGF